MQACDQGHDSDIGFTPIFSSSAPTNVAADSRVAYAAAAAPPADALLQRMSWLNEPPAWRIEGDRLIVHSTPKADFYRLSDWVADNGNFFHLPVAGDFRFEVRTAGEYRAKYDQIGLMMRSDSEHWGKCGNEFVDGRLLASAVVTQEHSDWSISTPLPLTTHVWWQFERSRDRIKASCSLDGVDFTMKATFPPAPTSRSGCCVHRRKDRALQPDWIR